MKKTNDKKPVDKKLIENKSINRKSVEKKIIDRRSVDKKLTDKKSFDRRSVDKIGKQPTIKKFTSDKIVDKIIDKNIDFDIEGIKLLKLLNIDSDKTNNNKNSYNPMDIVWKEPTKGGKIYIGSETSAKASQKLISNNITHIVNCTDKIPNHHEKYFKYYRFDISSIVWKFWNKFDEKDVYELLSPLFLFIDSALELGNSVLVHCLAGAHRAGTTGILSVMHYANFNQKTATAHVQKCRSVVEPIGNLKEILVVYEKTRKLFVKN